MRLRILFAFSVFASFLSFIGEARADIFRAFLLNSEMRYERASSQDLENRSPLNISLGYQYTRWSALLEYAQYKETSGNETSAFERKHAELVAWARYHAFGWTFGQGNHTVQMYGGVGAGGYQESVTTTFMGTSRTDNGKLTFMSGLSAGGEYSMKVTNNFLIGAALEGRALMASDFDPNPMWSAVLRLGIGFIL